MAVVLIACVLVVAFWEVMSNRSRRPFRPFELTAADFDGLAPTFPGWTVRGLPVGQDPTEPNIVVLQYTPLEQPSGPARAGAPSRTIVRLVHGYNMCDCMRLKGYTVELIGDQRAGRPSSPGNNGAERPAWRSEGFSGQVWRLTSGDGVRSIWLTSMLLAGDGRPLPVDVRDMPFPRIGVPGDPSWLSEGIRLKDLRHPIRFVRLTLRAKWNNSRCDWLTFLGLKQPAWANDEVLTLVTVYDGPSVAPQDERALVETMTSVHLAALTDIRVWRAAALKGSPRRGGADGSSPRH